MPTLVLKRGMDQWMLAVTLAQLLKDRLYVWKLLALVRLAAVLFHSLLFLTMYSSLDCLSFGYTMVRRRSSLGHIFCMQIPLAWGFFEWLLLYSHSVCSTLGLKHLAPKFVVWVHWKVAETESTTSHKNETALGDLEPGQTFWHLKGSFRNINVDASL